MEGTAVTPLCMDPFNLMSQSPANEASTFSLSHRYAQMWVSDLVVRSNALILTMTCVPHGCINRTHLYLFLDFTEKYPHSNSQTAKYAD